MIPILFPSDATEFTTQGLGALSAAISCTVTEERNGMYELELVYPMTGVHFAEIQDECLIYAIPSPYRSAQPFRIYRHTKPMGGKVTFYARHISYDLLDIPLNPCSAGSAPAAMVALQSNVSLPSPFVYWTDKDTVADWSVKVPSKSRSVLGGQSGSILDVYGGEYEWDGFTVKLHQERGRDNGVTIRYGKNLTDLEQDRNISDVLTGIYPYWTDANGENLVVCDPPIINASGTYKRTRVAPVDFSADFEEAPTPEQLQARAENYVKANQIGVPTVSITVSFVQLEQTMGYEHLALLEKVDLCDTVTVQYEELGVDATAKVVEIETDVLRARYNKVTLGDAKSTLTDTIINQGQEIQQRPTQSDLQQAISNATKWITNGKGYMVPVFDAAGNWSELVSLDRQSLTEAQNVWRWNNGGFGHSAAGYNGPYRTAITQDGHINADFIDVGTLVANIIRAGVLASVDGASSWDLDTGLVVFSNEKTYMYEDYTEDDETRLRDIVLGTVKPTEEDYTRYDFYQDGKITNTDRVLLRNMLNNQQSLTVKWECKFSSSTPGELLAVTATNMTSGTSYKIFALGSQNRVSIESGETLSTVGLLDYIYPVGSIYMSVSSSNPASLFGGTWISWGAGRVPVGVDTSDSSFSSVEKTGGEKTHTLTTNEMPSHEHTTSGSWGVEVTAGYKYTGTFNVNDNANGLLTEKQNMKVGGGAAHNNLQPYITCYMWKRTA